MRVTFIILIILLIASLASAKKVKYRKTQDVNFDGAELDGVVRNPMGAYITNKKALKFMPLYKVKDKMDQRLRNSLEYLR